METTEQSRQYHHGNLHDDLVTYALAKVRVSGVRSFSLRGAALACGVTPGAAYRHFADREAILRSVAQRGFQLFAQRIAAATANIADPAERLLVLGRNYVEFAATEPHLFRLMFSRMGTNGMRPQVTEPGSRADQQLARAIAATMGVPLDKVELGLITLAWAVAHGAAALVADGVWPPDDPGIEGSLRRVVALIKDI